VQKELLQKNTRNVSVPKKTTARDMTLIRGQH